MTSLEVIVSRNTSCHLLYNSNPYNIIEVHRQIYPNIWCPVVEMYICVYNFCIEELMEPVEFFCTTLDWPLLADRRKYIRQMMLYKILSNQVTGMPHHYQLQLITASKDYRKRASSQEQSRSGTLFFSRPPPIRS